MALVLLLTLVVAISVVLFRSLVCACVFMPTILLVCIWAPSVGVSVGAFSVCAPFAAQKSPTLAMFTFPLLPWAVCVLFRARGAHVCGQAAASLWGSVWERASKVLRLTSIYVHAIIPSIHVAFSSGVSDFLFLQEQF